MMIDPFLEALRETSTEVQRVLTELKISDDETMYEIINKAIDRIENNEIPDVEATELRKRLLKRYRNEKKIEAMAKNLFMYLDTHVSAVETELAGFREYISRTVLKETVGISSVDDGDDIKDDEGKYCYCDEPANGEMVACDNENCEIEWFHYTCVGLSSPPNGKWVCKECSRKGVS